MPKQSRLGRVRTRVHTHRPARLPGRARRVPSPRDVQRLDLRALATMCHAIGEEGRLQLFRRIAAAGRDGVEATDIADREGLAVLVAAGLVTVLPFAQPERYRAEVGRFTEALIRFSSPVARH